MPPWADQLVAHPQSRRRPRRKSSNAIHLLIIPSPSRCRRRHTSRVLTRVQAELQPAVKTVGYHRSALCVCVGIDDQVNNGFVGRQRRRRPMNGYCIATFADWRRACVCHNTVTTPWPYDSMLCGARGRTMCVCVCRRAHDRRLNYCFYLIADWFWTVLTPSGEERNYSGFMPIRARVWPRRSGSDCCATVCKSAGMSHTCHGALACHA